MNKRDLSRAECFCRIMVVMALLAEEAHQLVIFPMSFLCRGTNHGKIWGIKNWDDLLCWASSF